MSDSNDKTVQSYEAHIQEYVEGTPQQVTGYVKDWIDDALSHVPPGATVLELGSAFGRDAAYIESAGYKVQRSDVAKGFVNLLKSQGHDAKLLNALTDPLGGPYDMVFADAVLLHFTVDEFNTVSAKIYASLRTQGIFAFTVKQGRGSEWSDDKLGAPRFFQYWQREDLQRAVEQAGFKLLRLSADPAAKWWQVVAAK